MRLRAPSTGVPLVTTSLGAEGMNFRTPSEAALIADGPQEFALALAELCANQVRWVRQISEGRAHLRDHFSAESQRTSLRDLLTAIAS